VSVFDSLALCLYFLGNAIKPAAFPDVQNPRKITRPSTQEAMSAAFPNDAITGLLASLGQDARFTTLETIRNLLAHRLSGRRTTRSSGTLHEDGTYTTDLHEETWQLLARHLADITDLLSLLTVAAKTFAESSQAKKPNP
jgi:hypothetical protein